MPLNVARPMAATTAVAVVSGVSVINESVKRADQAHHTDPGDKVAHNR